MEKWFKTALFYEIYPTSFKDSNNDGIGDLKGITEKLNYIKSVGFTALWINPFFKSPFLDGGYDVSDFFKIDPKFGTMKDLEKLIKKAHKLNMRIIIDLIPGHSSEQNPLFLKSAKAKKNECTDLFIWNESTWSNQAPYLLISGRHERDANYLVNFFSHQPAFNYGFNEITYPEWQISYKDKRVYKARQLMIDIMNFYLEKGIDGFRVDMAAHLVKNDPNRSATIEVWNDIIPQIKEKYPDCFFISEWSDPEKAFKAGFDSDFLLDLEDNFYYHLARSEKNNDGRSVLKGGNTDFFEQNLLKQVEDAKKYNCSFSIISGNHDEKRIASILNRKELELFYLLQYTLPGIPFVYYGDEIGMKHKNIPSKDGGYRRTGDRTPMLWDTSTNKGFSKYNGKLYLPLNKQKENVKDELRDKNSLLNYIKKIISIRKQYPSLSNNNIIIEINDHVIKYSRDEIDVIINLSNKRIQIDPEKLIFSTQDNIKFSLKSKEAVILRK